MNNPGTTIRFSTFCFFVFAAHAHFAQTSAFNFERVPVDQAIYSQKFDAAEIYRVDMTSIKDYFIRQQARKELKFSLNLDGEELLMEATKVPIISDRYKLRLIGDGNEQIFDNPEVCTYKGILTGTEVKFRLTISASRFNLTLISGQDLTVIESASIHSPSLDLNFLIRYHARDILTKSGLVCESVSFETADLQEPAVGTIRTEPSAGEKIVELAMLANRSLWDSLDLEIEGAFFSIVNVMDGLYDNTFIHDFTFQVTEIVAFTGSGPPWANSTNPSTVLSSFALWANFGGFDHHDMGQIWSGRDFDSTTIGLAYVSNGSGEPPLCNDIAYQALQYINLTDVQRTILSTHETGHNFGLSHVSKNSPPFFVMEPAIGSGNTNWSNTSKNTLNNNFPEGSVTCLDIEGGTLPLDLISFEGQQERRQIVLKWVVQHGGGQVNFYVEKANSEGHFEGINEVILNRSEETFQRTLHSIDKNPQMPRNYYRLRYEEDDGEVSYSEVIEVFFEIDLDVQVWPNPISETGLQIGVFLESESSIEISLFSMEGRQVYREIVKGRSGENHIQAKLSGLGKGIYSLFLFTDVFVHAELIIRN